MSATAHTTVLLAEAVAALNIQPGGTYVDATFGRGGHSRAILAKLSEAGRLVAFDRDAAAVEAARDLTGDARFLLIHAPFGSLTQELAAHGLGLGAETDARAGVLDGVLLDLGVSSPQLDEAERGFSFRGDGPLDMRMDQSRGLTAAEWLAAASAEAIEEVIRDYGEERFAKQIARALVAARERQPLRRTSELAELVAATVRTREPGQHPATRSFQAIRIFINQELEELEVVLPQCPGLLKPGGRLAVISFHSLEDRIVKHFLKQESTADTLPERLPVRAADLPQPKMKLVGKPIRASSAEVAANPRARSATLRVAERLPNRPPVRGPQPVAAR